MGNIELIPIRRASPELRSAYAAARGFLGIRWAFPVLPEIIQGLCQRPALLHSTFEAYFYASRCGRLPCAVREMVAVQVSQANDCFY